MDESNNRLLDDDDLAELRGESRHPSASLPVNGDGDNGGFGGWNNPGPNLRGRHALQAPAETPTGEGEAADCVIIGPPGAGKTHFLMGIAQACECPRKGDRPLQFLPDEEADTLVSQAVDLVTGKNAPAATTSIGEYTFHLRAFSRRSVLGRGQPRDFRMTVSDGPGELFFGDEGMVRPEWRAQEGRLMGAARRARSLVLCVDVMNPRVDRLMKGLPALIRKIAGDVERPLPPRNLLEWAFGRLPLREWQKGLEVERFLLVLTKIDIAVAHASFALANIYKTRNQRLPDWARPASLAHRIDPLEQAKAVVGLPILNMIDHALGPRAQFGVACCSTGGFHPETGEPFLTEDGRPNLDAIDTRDSILRRWRPFGVREAIEFVTYGETSGPAGVILPEDLLTRRGEKHR